MRLLRALRDLNLTQKLFVSFTLIIVIPLLISYAVYQREADEVLIRRVFRDTLVSLQLVGTRVEDILWRMTYVSLYVSKDEKLRAVLSDALPLAEPPAGGDLARVNLEHLQRLNTAKAIFDNLSFNILRVKSYFTLTSDNALYTSWPTGSPIGQSYLEAHAASTLPNFGLYVHWVGVEETYVASDSADYPFVLTLMKSITDTYGSKHIGTLILSVPEAEFSRLMFRDEHDTLWFLVDQEGVILSTSHQQYVRQSFSSVYAGAFPREESGYFVGTRVGGGKALFTYAKIKDQEWTLFNVESFAAITRTPVRLRYRFLAANLIGAALFAGVAALIARGISRPLRELTSKMLNLNLSPMAAAAGRNLRRDEIGILENSFAVMSRRIKRLLSEVEKKEQMKRGAELEALLLQVSPHFLFNTLNTIRWAIINRNPDKASEMLLALARLLRVTLSQGSELISLAQEIEVLKSYVAILKMRHETALEVRYDISDGAAEAMIPRLLLQPIVENAIVHGFGDLETAGRIQITATGKDGLLQITVRDNGKGFDVSRLKESRAFKGLRFSGIGISNVDQRIKLHFGERFGLRIDSREGGGTTVRVEIPLS